MLFYQWVGLHMLRALYGPSLSVFQDAPGLLSLISFMHSTLHSSMSMGSLPFHIGCRL